MFNWENIIFHPIQLIKVELIKLRTEKLKIYKFLLYITALKMLNPS